MRATGDKVERNRRGGREERVSGVAFVTRGAFHLDPIMKSVMPWMRGEYFRGEGSIPAACDGLFAERNTVGNIF